MRNYELQKKDFLKFLKLLSDNNLLNTVVVAGSWAEYIYAQSGLLKGFDGELRTLDADFLIKNMRLPREPVSILKLAEDAGYAIKRDTLEETAKIITRDGLEIEFLLNQMGSGAHRVLPTNLGIHAQALRHMDISLRNSVTVDLFTMPVTVPKPEAYTIHKMVINKDRKPGKREKDKDSIYRLAPFLDEEEFKTIYNGLFKKEQKRVDEFIQEHGPLFEANKSVEAVLNRAYAKAGDKKQHSGKDDPELS